MLLSTASAESPAFGGPAVALPLLLPTVLRLRCGDGLRAWALRRRGAIASRQAQCTSNSSTSVSTATALGHHHWARALRRCGAAARKLPVQLECVTSASSRAAATCTASFWSSAQVQNHCKITYVFKHHVALACARPLGADRACCWQARGAGPTLGLPGPPRATARRPRLAPRLKQVLNRYLV